VEAAAVIFRAAAVAVQRLCTPTLTTPTRHRPVLLRPLSVAAANHHLLTDSPTTL